MSVNSVEPAVESPESQGQEAERRAQSDAPSHAAESPETARERPAASISEWIAHFIDDTSGIEGPVPCPDAGPSTEAPSPEAPPSPPPEPPATTVASVPFMITNARRLRLVGLGYSERDIDGMTPQQALDLETGGVKHVPPNEVAGDSDEDK